MESSPLAQTIVQHRKRQGLSQEELADRAKVSLRTIQRLENGQNVPRGYTLQLLAQALDVPLERLTDPQRLNADRSVSRSRLPFKSSTVMALMHLLALSFLLMPGANLIIPFILRLWYRQQADVYEAGGRLLNFELVWSLIAYGGHFGLLALQTALLAQEDTTLIWAPFYYLWGLSGLHIVLLLVGAGRAATGDFRTLPGLIRVF